MLKSIRLIKRCAPTRLVNSIRSYYSPRYLEYLRSLPAAHITQLDNGMTVASEDRGTFHVTVGLIVDAGARHEEHFENGVTHLMEHLAFTGTADRPRNTLLRDIADSGATFHVRTTRQTTAYLATCLCEHLPLVVNLLADCVFKNQYDPAAIDAQKDIIYQEMLHLDHEPHALLMDYLHQTAYQGTALAQPVLGRSDSVCALDATGVRRYAARALSAERVVLAACGGLDHDELLALAATTLGCVPTAPCPPAVCNPRFTGSEIRYRNDDWPAAYVAVAFEAPCYCDEDRVTMEVARRYLGAWVPGQPGGEAHPARLARAASTGLCHSYRTFSVAYSDTALWGVSFVGESVKLEDFLYNVQDEVMHLCCSVSDAELERARAATAAGALRAAASCARGAAALGRSALYRGAHDPLHARVCAAASVSAADVRAACSKYLYDKCPAVAAVGPTEGLPEYNRIRSGTYWLRL